MVILNPTLLLALNNRFKEFDKKFKQAEYRREYNLIYQREYRLKHKEKLREYSKIRMKKKRDQERRDLLVQKRKDNI